MSIQVGKTDIVKIKDSSSGSRRTASTTITVSGITSTEAFYDGLSSDGTYVASGSISLTSIDVPNSELVPSELLSATPSTSNGVDSCSLSQSGVISWFIYANRPSVRVIGNIDITYYTDENYAWVIKDSNDNFLWRKCKPVTVTSNDWNQMYVALEDALSDTSENINNHIENLNYIKEDTIIYVPAGMAEATITGYTEDSSSVFTQDKSHIYYLDELLNLTLNDFNAETLNFVVEERPALVYGPDFSSSPWVWICYYSDGSDAYAIRTAKVFNKNRVPIKWYIRISHEDEVRNMYSVTIPAYGSIANEDFGLNTSDGNGGQLTWGNPQSTVIATWFEYNGQTTDETSATPTSLTIAHSPTNIKVTKVDSLVTVSATNPNSNMDGYYVIYNGNNEIVDKSTNASSSCSFSDNTSNSSYKISFYPIGSDGYGESLKETLTIPPTLYVNASAHYSYNAELNMYEVRLTISNLTNYPITIQGVANGTTGSLSTTLDAKGSLSDYNTGIYSSDDQEADLDLTITYNNSTTYKSIPITSSGS